MTSAASFVIKSPDSWKATCGSSPSPPGPGSRTCGKPCRSISSARCRSNAPRRPGKSSSTSSGRSSPGAAHTSRWPCRPRARLQAQLHQERQDQAVVRNEIWILSPDLKTRLQADALERYLGHAEELWSRLRADLEAAMPQWRSNLRKTAETFAEWVHDTLQERFGSISYQEGEELTARHLAAAQGSVARVVRAFQDRLAKSIE